MSTRLPRVLVVEDEARSLELIRASLQQRGFVVLEVCDGDEALRRARDDVPDLVLLDLCVPGCDGFALLKRLRTQSTVPVIALTVGNDEAVTIGGLDMGADDCVTKPFSPGELVARIRAVLRRSGWSRGLCTGLVAADERLQIDFDEREVLVDGERIPLSPTEYRLLYHLVQNAGRTLPFEALLTRAWGPEYRRETHYVHLYVAYLRQKIEPDLANPRYILTRRGLGYSFRALAAAG